MTVCERWKAFGEEADVLPWTSAVTHLGLDESQETGISEAVVVPHQYRIECVLASKPNWNEVYRGVHELLDRGWGVTVLAPLSDLGTAHKTLSGLQTVLQGWWMQEDRRLRFSTEEIA